MYCTKPDNFEDEVTLSSHVGVTIKIEVDIEKYTCDPSISPITQVTQFMEANELVPESQEVVEPQAKMEPSEVSTQPQQQAPQPIQAVPITPPTLYIRVFGNNDTYLKQIRKKFRNYRFQWMCLRCPFMCYQKPAYRNHLSKIHNLLYVDFQQMVAVVKPFLPAKSREQLQREQEMQESELPTTSTGAKRTKNKQSTFTCAKCGKVFCNQTFLNSHYWLNCNARLQFQCITCKRYFCSMGELQEHDADHTEQMPSQ